MGRLVSCGPAYGRDYKTADEVIAAWENERDFKIQDLFIRGTYIGINDDGAGLDLKIRYNKLQYFVIVKEDGTYVVDDSAEQSEVVHEFGSPRDHDFRIE